MDDFRLKTYKKDFTYSYTLGAFPSVELFENRSSDVLRVVLSREAEDSRGASKLKGLAEKFNVPTLIDDRTIQRISPKENIYAICVFSKYTCDINKTKNHVVLVNPSDMGNLGTILRTLTAFGMYDIAIISPAADIFDPKVARASMGALFRMNFKFFKDFTEYFNEYGDNRKIYPFMLGGQDLEGISMPKEKELYTLVFGNESKGLSDAFFNIGQPVEIRHLKTVDSLNLTVALGIGVYHFSKG